MEKIDLEKMSKMLNDYKEKFPKKFEEEELSDLTENSDRSYEMEVDRDIYYSDN